MSQPPAKSRLAVLTLAALGVVYGDIGTSPLYSLRECFAGAHAVAVTADNVLGILSLIFWSLIITVTLNYLLFVMQADNHGEGGILALVALVRSKHGKIIHPGLVAAGLFGAALLYGDGMITPAISVLSAVEGLGAATTMFEPFVVPITLVILVVMFLSQRHGTEGIGKVFGPVMIVWFLTLAALGLPQVMRNPEVLAAINPVHGYIFLTSHGFSSFVTLGSVFLSVTGAEALYADMGHFGRRPIRLAWFTLVLPSLVLNYMGQGALMLNDPATREHPFFFLAPGWAMYPLVVMSAMAAVIASQAVISGAFSLTQQAIQLGYSPRLDIHHTSAHQQGQVYVPAVNWLLMLSTIGLVLGFRSSTNLASAYGIAVTTTMVITSVLANYVAREKWGWPVWRATLVSGIFIAVDLAFFGANVIKIPSGGWFPLLVAVFIYVIMTTWAMGRQLVVRKLAENEVTLSDFFSRMAAKPPLRVSGTGIFMTARPEGAPPILVHHLTHNKALNEQIILLTVSMVEVPTVPMDTSISVEQLAGGFWRVVAKFGYMDPPDVPAALERAKELGLSFRADDTTYYMAHLTLFTHTESRIGMSTWRDKLFVFISRNARAATSFFQIPPDRVIEIGIQLEL